MADKIRLELTYPEFSEILLFCADNRDVPELDQLHRILEAKLNKLLEHELYTKYKTAPTEEEKEKARQEFLDRRGIRQDFRW